MDDFNFWWYIIAAVIYFLTKGKKKKGADRPSRPGTENNPTPSTSRPKSFEDLLREITEGATDPNNEPVQEPVVIREDEAKEERKDPIKDEGRRRVFADDESRKVYQESIKMAEGADIEFAPNEHFKTSKHFGRKDSFNEKTIADEIMEDFDTNEAKKAVIYSEIFNRKY